MTSNTMPAAKASSQTRHLTLPPFAYAGYGRCADGSLHLVRDADFSVEKVAPDHADAAERELLDGWGSAELVDVPVVV